MYAYSESYISESSAKLGSMCDYLHYDLNLEPDELFRMFATSEIGRSFERGNPAIVAGLSGIEIGRKLIYEKSGEWTHKEASQTINRSEIYWSGYSLAYYQWNRNLRFEDLIDYGVTLSWAMERYILHEADMTKFYLVADQRIETFRKEEKSRLKRLRHYHQLTQKELSDRSGVSLRMIQLYEQGQNDISHAQINIVKALADALNCDIVDLL